MRRPSVFDGPSAIEAVTRQQPDVVLLDLCLPGMSGIEVAARASLRSRAIAGRPRRSHRPWQPDMLPSPSPFDRYFAKPVDFASLLAYLSEIGARQSWRTPLPDCARDEEPARFIPSHAGWAFSDALAAWSPVSCFPCGLTMSFGARITFRRSAALGSTYNVGVRVAARQ